MGHVCVHVPSAFTLVLTYLMQHVRYNFRLVYVGAFSGADERAHEPSDPNCGAGHDALAAERVLLKGSGPVHLLDNLEQGKGE
jgi:hypothetical protein